MAKKSKVAPQDLYLGIVVDKSGSMSGCRDSTISAFNEYLNDRKKELGKTLVWLTLFDTNCTYLNPGVDVRDVRELNHENYVPSGMTALYDAIGGTVREMEGRVKAESFKGKILFVIQTDGHENSSREWNRDMIVALIKEKEAEGNWTFIYLGADQDAFGASAAIGIGAANTVGYASAATGQSMGMVSQQTAHYRTSSGTQTREFTNAPVAAPIKRRKAAK